ncbi:MAG: PHP domain-containing protein, partial [Betaproteobacteria bacterium]|nr:PHP domain-containing protein [Betaproteobacteria bacterium]
MSSIPGYAELHCLSNFSFQRGASHPEELVARAAALGYRALAITDECSVAGLVRAHTEAKKLGLQLLPGAELTLPDGSTLVALPHNLDGWGNLCEAISQARRAAPKGSYQMGWDDLAASPLPACELLLLPPFAMQFEALH